MLFPIVKFQLHVYVVCVLNDFHNWLEKILEVWNLLVRQCIMRKDPTICHTMDILHGHTMRPGILNNIVEMDF